MSQTQTPQPLEAHPASGVTVLEMAAQRRLKQTPVGWQAAPRLRPRLEPLGILSAAAAPAERQLRVQLLMFCQGVQPRPPLERAMAALGMVVVAAEMEARAGPQTQTHLL
jgi:hypothetical protein